MKISLLNPSKWTLSGVSRAGAYTSLFINEPKILLDAGRVPKKFANYIIISHAHPDHSWDLFNAVHKRHPVPLIANTTTMPLLMNMLGVLNDLCEGQPTDHSTELIQEEMGVQPHTEPYFEDEKISIKMFPAYHTRTCISNGFGISSKRKRLKQQYHKYGPNTLKQLDRNSLHEEYSVKEFIFFGDSTIDCLFLNNEWKQYPVIIVEMTNLTGDMRKRGHTSMEDLQPLIASHPEKQWILTHLSKAITRKQKQEIRDQYPHVFIVDS